MAGGQKKRFFGEIFATVRLFPSCFFVFSVFWVMVRGLGTLQFATGRLFSDDRFFFDSCVEDGGYICDRNGFCDMFTLGLRGDMGTGCGDAAAMDLALCFQKRRCVVGGCYSHIPSISHVRVVSGPRVQKRSEYSAELSFKLRAGFRVCEK